MNDTDRIDWLEERASIGWSGRDGGQVTIVFDLEDIDGIEDCNILRAMIDESANESGDQIECRACLLDERDRLREDLRLIDRGVVRRVAVDEWEAIRGITVTKHYTLRAALDAAREEE